MARATDGIESAKSETVTAIVNEIETTVAEDDLVAMSSMALVMIGIVIASAAILVIVPTTIGNGTSAEMSEGTGTTIGTVSVTTTSAIGIGRVRSILAIVSAT